MTDIRERRVDRSGWRPVACDRAGADDPGSVLKQSLAWLRVCGACLLAVGSLAFGVSVETLAQEQPVDQAPAAPTDNPVTEVPATEVPATETPTQDSGESPGASADSAAAAGNEAAQGLIRLSKDDRVWIDPKRKMVVVDGFVCLRRGQLEMFACPKGTKEHESIVAVYAKPSLVHAGLLAVGAEAGSPVQFDPEYAPAKGTPIEVLVLWKDSEGKKHRVRAQEWLRDVKSGKAMETSWVFAGSGFWVEEATGNRYYHADGGDFICVSNFPTATLDLPIASSQDNANLLYEAFTERLPPLKTEVRLVLYPLVKDKKDVQKQAAKDESGEPTTASPEPE